MTSRGTSLLLPRVASQTFTVNTPKDTHMVPASCRETRCKHHVEGWTTVVPTLSVQADYIKHMSERRFREQRVGDGTTMFHFDPGQECFRPHFRKLEKSPVMIHRVGQDIRTKEIDHWLWDMNEEFNLLSKERG